MLAPKDIRFSLECPLARYVTVHGSIMSLNLRYEELTDKCNAYGVAVRYK